MPPDIGCTMTALAREQSIGDHDDACGLCNRRSIAGTMRHQHEKSDAEPGAEQHSGAEHVNELEREQQIGHRSSTMASVNSVAINMGTILSSGPSGSSQRCGVRIVPASR